MAPLRAVCCCPAAPRPWRISRAPTLIPGRSSSEESSSSSSSRSELLSDSDSDFIDNEYDEQAIDVVVAPAGEDVVDVLVDVVDVGEEKQSMNSKRDDQNCGGVVVGGEDGSGNYNGLEELCRGVVEIVEARARDVFKPRPMRYPMSSDESSDDDYVPHPLD